MEILYSTKATATGGRNGHVKSADGALDVDVRMPAELGGSAKSIYLNPETLFAGGYAACFDSALGLVLGQKKLKPSAPTSTTAKVSIGKTDSGAFGLAVTLQVNVPGLQQAVAEEVVKTAHSVCPYSNATRGNVEVTLEVTTENTVNA